MTDTSSLVQLKTIIEGTDASLLPLLLSMIRGKEASRWSGFTEQAADIALTAMMNTGVNAGSALAIFALNIYDQDLASAGISDPEILRIARGIKAVQNLNTEKANIQSDNFMKLLLLLSEDMQALLAVKGIKLWQMRHFELVGTTERDKLVSDIEHLYLPLAHRLGLYSVKSEMEEFIMRQNHPEIYRAISGELHESEEERLAYIERFIAPLRDILAVKGFDTEIRYRVKTIASIWKKMQVQKVALKDVYDVFAIRIIHTGSEETGKARCWEIYSLITDIYKPDPTRLRDWISVPRPSGYESLHTTVLGPEHRWVEVQIRTKRMDYFAEHGPAAHWRYKDPKQRSSDAWLQRVRQLLEPLPSGELLITDKQKALPITDEIFTMTPVGDLIRLKAGSTVLDFAFDIHTEVGLRCRGAKVNGRFMPIRHRLKNGDKVEILTSTQLNVSEDWLKIVISPRARNRIRKALQERHETASLAGKEMLERKLRQWKAGSLDENVNTLMQHFRIKEVSAFYLAIATEKISTAALKEVIEKGTQVREETVLKKTAHPETNHPFERSGSEDVLLIYDEIETTDYQLAPCCKPVLGDDVFGFVTVGKGIRIHRNQCPNAFEMKSRYPYRVIPCRWAGKEGEGGVHVSIAVSGKDKLGIVNAITDVISNDIKVMIRSVSFESSQGKFNGMIRIFVKDEAHIGWIIRKICRVEGVDKATRVRSQSY